MKNQKGVGLIEVLVSLLVLAIGILGFVILQARAIEATGESAQRIQAINIARDIAERIRANRDGWAKYKVEFASTAKQKDGSKSCATATNTDVCTADELADFDAREVESYASQLGMSISVQQCQKANTGDHDRQCVYVAWNNTIAGNSATDSETACTKGTAYQVKSACLIMEIY
ncbi:type IV pilus modification protein PilV [Acinetobacter pseudolwoffii]|uniref:type IV pilus modification protein PilV n=1 Tax=Acinetobacter pseudolwoffii TaxID=2053287 RepID=UPI002578412D|nr:type IV pilus modification protein PilV [Acinetobacter pseudolwoffii]MDM1342395.1 type IV pilus modification protein PilV [Acinetobacter pseudolwoffii]